MKPTQTGLGLSFSRHLMATMIACLALPALVGAQETQEQREAALSRSLFELRGQLPSSAAGFESERVQKSQELCRRIDAQCGLVLYGPMQRPEEWLPRLRAAVRAKEEIDGHLKRLLELRFQLAESAGSESGRNAVRAFLRATTDLIDLSGRLNFQLRDAVIFSSMAAARQQDLRERLVDQIDADRSPIGAAMLATLLIDPPPDSLNRALPATDAIKQKVLAMLGQRGGNDVLPLIVNFLKNATSTSDLKVLAADAAIRSGLPQNALPPADPENARPPLITAGELATTLTGMDSSAMSPALVQHRNTLTAWLGRRKEVGVTAAGYWNGSCAIQPGDWLLMRNSSPYNLFTDLSPGLFTHVGVASLHTDASGVQHMVVVDLNERETVIRPRNVEDALAGSLYYAVLRHDDKDIANTMSEVAASLIGNPMKFDLTFETTRAAALKGQPLKGVKIETYCAGLLLMCAQETGAPRSEFFPLIENCAPGKTAENMDRIGLKVGADFISPTGPLFARRMKLVHFSEPMFDPRRDIEQRIYDHFSHRMEAAVIEPKTSLYQSLRQQLAEASKENPLLARAIADAAGVDRETDLAKAARAAAVVETLDEVAYGASADFRDTLVSFRAGPLDDRAKGRFSAEDIERYKSLRELHADLYQKLDRRQISPRDLTETLIAHYVAAGKLQIDKYFFSAIAPAPSEKSAPAPSEAK